MYPFFNKKHKTYKIWIDITCIWLITKWRSSIYPELSFKITIFLYIAWINLTLWLSLLRVNKTKPQYNKMYREQFLRRIFAAGVDSVRPQTIFRSRELVKVVADTEIHVWNGGKRITIDLPARTHVIGFGKGVFGLALEMERILGDHLVSGQINVPVRGSKACQRDTK